MTSPHVAPVPFYGRAIRWLMAFSVVSTVVSIVGPFHGDRGMDIATGLPFYHLMGFWAVVFVRGIFVPRFGSQIELYLKERHRDLYELFAPWQGGILGISRRPKDLGRAWRFIMGHYQGEWDDVLTYFRVLLHREQVILIWPFALVLFNWMIAMVLYFGFGLAK